MHPMTPIDLAGRPDEDRDSSETRPPSGSYSGPRCDISRMIMNRYNEKIIPGFKLY